MDLTDDPFLLLAEGAVAESDGFAALAKRPASAAGAGAETPDGAGAVPFHAPTVARLEGFDLLDQPRVTGLANLRGEVVTARSTIALKRAQIGRDVLVMFANGDWRQPVIVGVIDPRPLWPEAEAEARPPAAASAIVDGERRVIEAEREVVLRCGDASITLTRAGKVIIKGHYILSRSTGYNKIKGAAVDIN